MTEMFWYSEVTGDVTQLRRDELGSTLEDVADDLSNDEWHPIGGRSDRSGTVDEDGIEWVEAWTTPTEPNGRRPLYVLCQRGDRFDLSTTSIDDVENTFDSYEAAVRHLTEAGLVMVTDEINVAPEHK